MKADRLLFNAQFYYRPEAGEKNSGCSICDPSGYIPAKERIENIMRAGERLDEYRREQYHYGPDDEDDGYSDPMDEPGLDLADVHRMRRDALRRLAAQAAARRDDELKSVAEDASQSDAAMPVAEPKSKTQVADKPPESPAGASKPV